MTESTLLCSTSLNYDPFSNNISKPKSTNSLSLLHFFMSFALSTMFSIFILFVSILSLLSLSFSESLSGTFIDCGTVIGSNIDGTEWQPDNDFVSSGTPKNVITNVSLPVLSTVRSFPNKLHQKFCYVVPVFRGAKYLIRTTYFYGGVNGRESAPVFDQMVDGSFWSVVNTTADYALGLPSYYEGVFLAQGKSMSLCVGSNNFTDSDPFISALEFVRLEESLYNSTDFSKFGLRLIARHSFGYNGTKNIRDPFDRFWVPFVGNNHALADNANVSVSGVWNLPPLKIFETPLATEQPKYMELMWPPVSLSSSIYYVALYFADNLESLPGGTRVFDIIINDVPYYRNLSVTTDGAAVFATKWPLAGSTKITLKPVAGSKKGPLINGGEIFQVLELTGRTLTKDVIALETFKSCLQNPPLDWNGDPCLPHLYSWTGITCNYGRRIRVVTLNLTNMGLSGSLPPNISRLSALNSIWLGSNNLSGAIPDLSLLTNLEKLHLEDNQFSGNIPSSLGKIQSLRELFLQNNNLTGQIPSSLIKPGLNFKTSPGNNLSSPQPS